MIRCLATAAREIREAKGIGRSHIAACDNCDQSTVTRFEAGRAWPRNPDALIRCYSELTGVPVPEIWQRATELMARGFEASP